MIDELLALACRLAVEAGDRALSGRRSDAVKATTKSSTTDLVTIHDRAAEEAIVAGLGAARPDDAIVGEEGTNRAGTSGISWFVDPIDGTTNFVYDLPLWSTSIAATDAEGALVGAVYAPPLGELFAAGAWPGRDVGRATDRLQRPHRGRSGPRRYRLQLSAGAPPAAGCARRRRDRGRPRRAPAGLGRARPVLRRRRPLRRLLRDRVEQLGCRRRRAHRPRSRLSQRQLHGRCGRDRRSYSSSTPAIFEAMVALLRPSRGAT